MKTISIKDRIESKPSAALIAMCDGLEAQAAMPDFTVDMDEFGYVDETNGLCYGCAATCAVLRLLPEMDPKELIKWSGLSSLPVDERIDRDDLDEFEYAVNHARIGDLACLFEYCGMPESVLKELTLPRFHLDTDDWQEQIPTVRACAAYLNTQGY